MSGIPRRDFMRSTLVVAGAVALTGTLGDTAFASAGDSSSRPAADRAADRIIDRVKRPRIPRRDFPITRFGAVDDGVTDNSAAIAAAIQEAVSRGGGRIVIPAGTWATGPIHLKSRTELHVSAGATLLFSTDPAAYLPTVYSRWQGIELMNYSPLIYAYGEHDVAVTGTGVLDGQASTANWWAWKKLGDADFATFEATVNAGLPVAQRDGTKYHFRPAFFEPYDCERVLIEGVTLRNSPFWHLHPTLCRDVDCPGRHR